jgi:hypothetical protein
MSGAQMGSLDVYLVTDVSDDSKRVENLKWHKNGDAVSFLVYFIGFGKFLAWFPRRFFDFNPILDSKNTSLSTLSYSDQLLN